MKYNVYVIVYRLINITVNDNGHATRLGNVQNTVLVQKYFISNSNRIPNFISFFNTTYNTKFVYSFDKYAAFCRRRDCIETNSVKRFCMYNYYMLNEIIMRDGWYYSDVILKGVEIRNNITEFCRLSRGQPVEGRTDHFSRMERNVLTLLKPKAKSFVDLSGVCISWYQ